MKVENKTEDIEIIPETINIKKPNLYEILEISTKDLATQLATWCDKKGEKYWLKIPKSNKSDRKVMLVAHIDKSMTNNKIKVLHDPKHNMFWSPDGLGADDRAGVYALLVAWHKIPAKERPFLLFCDEEERGCIGAKEASGDLLDMIKKEVLFMLEPDRRGHNDMIFYTDCSNKFKKFIKSFKFEHSFGSCSDISILSRDSGIAATNLSIGYYDQHSKYETLHGNVTEKNTGRMIQICLKGQEEMKQYRLKTPVATKPKKIPFYNSQQKRHWERDDNAYQQSLGVAQKIPDKVVTEGAAARSLKREIQDIYAFRTCPACNTKFRSVEENRIYNGLTCPECYTNCSIPDHILREA